MTDPAAQAENSRVTPLPIAVLISGSGSTLRNLLERQANQKLDVDIRLVISSRSDAGGLAFAQEYGVRSRVIKRNEFESTESFSDVIFEECKANGIELVVMGGFLKHVAIPTDFENRVVNVHPSLIPAFCGKGFYGARVHQAVLDYGCTLSGCTIHYVDNEFDHGPIIAQRTVDVFPTDTAESLAARIGKVERDVYPEVIQAIAEKRVEVQGRQVTTKPRA